MLARHTIDVNKLLRLVEIEKIKQVTTVAKIRENKTSYYGCLKSGK